MPTEQIIGIIFFAVVLLGGIGGSIWIWRKLDED